MLKFHPLSPSDKRYFPTTTQYLAYNYYYSFALLWSDVIGLTVAKSETALYLRLRDENRFFLPITDNLPKAMEELEQFCDTNGTTPVLVGIPTDEALQLKEMGYTLERMRNFDDYLYESESLIKLGGKKLQSKRNHISKFERQYTYTLYSMSREKIREECYAMASTTWLESQGEVTKEMEEELMALRNAFDNWDELNLLGMVICIDHHLSAFTVGEIIDDEMAIIHFEKGDTSFSGIYSVINQLFCSQYLSDVRYINRQEDAGVPGLRKAKLSYRPVKMVEKYKATRKWFSSTKQLQMITSN